MRADAHPAVREQAAEALWLLDDKVGLTDLVGLSISARPDEQMMGVLGLAARKDPSVAGHIRSVFNSPTEGDYFRVHLVAARALAMACPGSGPDSPYDLGYAAAMKGAASRDARQRTLAALALGEIARSDTQETLAKLLKDDDKDVRVAAATAALQVGQSPRSVNGQLPDGVVARAAQP
jgi:HEAT repeat protein